MAAKRPKGNAPAQPVPVASRPKDPLFKMIVGTLAGTVFGLLAGRSVDIQFGGSAIEMDIPGAALGAIIGFSIARLVAGKAPEPPKAEAQAKKK